MPSVSIWIWLTCVFFSVQVTTCAGRCHRAEPKEHERYQGSARQECPAAGGGGKQGGPDDVQNRRGLGAAGPSTTLPRRSPGQQRHLRGAAQPLPAAVLHPRAPRAGGRAGGDHLRFPGNVPLTQEEAPEQEDPARAGGIRARQSQPRARRPRLRGAREAVRHRATGEA